MIRRWVLHRWVLLLSSFALLAIATQQCITDPKILPAGLFNGVLSANAQGEADGMGPYDTAVLPLDDIPSPGNDVYRRPLPLSEEYAQSEVVRVLQDPRTIPLERFLYYKHPYEIAREPGWLQDDQRPAFEERVELLEQVVRHPEADLILDHFEEAPYRAVAVYVRVQGGTYEVETVDSQGNTGVRSVDKTDPFYVKHPTDDYHPTRINPFSDSTDWRYPPWIPWSQLAVAASESNLTLPCMPQQVVDPGQPYPAPDSGESFDPESYLPPKPRYSPQPTIGEGEVSEGWLLCMAPDMPGEDVELVVQFRDPFTGERRGARSVWKPAEYLQMGDWYLLKDAKIAGWNGSIERYPRTDFEDDPPEDAQVVYQGPVWVSAAMAMGYRPVDKLAPDEAAQYDQINIALQMHFEGMETLLDEWDLLAVKNSIQASVFSNEILSDDCRIFMADDINVWSEGYWLSVEALGSKPETLWIALSGIQGGFVEWGINRDWRGATPVWRIDLLDTGERVTNTDEVCEHTECIDLNRDVYLPSGEFDFRGPKSFDGDTPIIEPDVYANGVMLTRAHYFDEVFQETAGVSLHRSGPQGRDTLILIEGGSMNGDLYEFDLYCDIAGKLTFTGEADPRALYGNLNDVFAVIDGIHSRTRKSSDGLVFFGDTDTLCGLDEMLILMRNTGPVWRMK
jgi:hypothetical protein